MDGSKLLLKIKYRSHISWDCNSCMKQLMIQICMKHIVSHILYGLSLFLAFYVTMKGPFVSSSGLYFTKKRCIGNPMICQVYLMACDLLWIMCLSIIIKYYLTNKCLFRGGGVLWYLGFGIWGVNKFGIWDLGGKIIWDLGKIFGIWDLRLIKFNILSEIHKLFIYKTLDIGWQ